MSDESQLASHCQLLGGEKTDNTWPVGGGGVKITEGIGVGTAMMRIPAGYTAAERRGCLQPDQLCLHKESWLCLVTQTGVDIHQLGAWIEP